MKTLVLLFLSLTINGFAQKTFTPQADLKTLKSWIKEAKESNEIDKNELDRIFEIHTDLAEGSTDANHVYNFGRAIHKAIQPSFGIQNHTYSTGGIRLLEQAELAYRFAINNCNCHGRANIMLGTLYNSENKYYLSEPYLEKGLQLEEGSEDWMIAANQYTLAGAYTNNTKTEKYRAVYKKFKAFAFKDGVNPYYTKMANLYQPYYEH